MFFVVISLAKMILKNCTKNRKFHREYVLKKRVQILFKGPD